LSKDRGVYLFWTMLQLIATCSISRVLEYSCSKKLASCSPIVDNVSLL